MLWASLVLGGPSFSTVVRADGRDQAIAAFAASGYTYCDAVVLASRWHQQPLDVKATIGRKVSGGSGDVVKTELARARTDAQKDPSRRCPFYETGLEYGDAQKLAQLWKTSVDNAKALVEQKILTDGGEQRVHALLGQPARQPGLSQNNDLAAFLASGYTFCDAKVLAAHWGSSVDDAKATVGRKIGWGNASIVETELRHARDEALKDSRRGCRFYETGLTYGDAVKLSQLWTTSVDKAKALVEQKILYEGGEQNLRAILGPPEPTPNDDLASFFTSGYTYCDAKVLAAHWKSSLDDAKATVGVKVGRGITDYVKDELRLARAEAQKDPSRGCRFDETGLRYGDAQKLAKLWKTSVDKAKALVEQKILTDGGEQRIHALLAPPKTK
jgi:hypothetical protein